MYCRFSKTVEESLRYIYIEVYLNLVHICISKTSKTKRFQFGRQIVMHATRKRKAKKKNKLLNCPVERRSTIQNFPLFHSSFVGFLVQAFSVQYVHTCSPLSSSSSCNL